MNLFESIKARYRNFKINHFDRFEGKQLMQYKNIHLGRRCFIIGNGPSLLSTDLDTLQQHDEITFAFNRIYNIFSETSWRPTYYISQDEKLLPGCVDEVNKISSKKKFIPIEMDWYYNVHVKNATYFHLLTKNFEKIDFSIDIPNYLYNTNTVVYTAIQFAYYMGFKEIYLIGVDHHFHISKTSKGDIMIDPTAKDYFSDSYNLDKKDLYIPNLDLSTLAFEAAEQFSRRLGFRIFNATRGGMLEVFERKNFNELFPKIL